MINIVYPYSKDKAKWVEIIYSIKSIRKYFTEESYQIHIIGPIDPQIPDTNFIPYFDKEGFTAEQANGGKLFYCCHVFEEFIWMNDDMYLLKPTSIEDIKTLQPLCNMTKYKTRGTNRWQTLLWNTHDLLKQMEIKDVYNYSTHTPQYYNSEKLKWLNNIISIFEGKALLEIAYFNWFQETVPEFMTEIEKAGFYDKNSTLNIVQIKEKMKGCRFLNHDDNGLSDDLKKVIFTLFD